MSNLNTGFWSALGAVLGGAAGAMAGKYASENRPSYRHAAGPSRFRGAELEDAMVVGGAAGAVVGAFLGGAIGGEPAAPQLTASTK